VYHGAEHVSIGTHENGGTPAPKEHPRCGSQPSRSYRIDARGKRRGLEGTAGRAA
jgi:hypothetical protein